jgi:hypothetical protein
MQRNGEDIMNTKSRNRISTYDLRAAVDRLIYSKNEYGRKFSTLTPQQIRNAESILESAHIMIILATKKLNEISQ